MLTVADTYKGTSDPRRAEKAHMMAERLVVLFEGERLVVYPDQGGKPTVGRGHLVRKKDGLKIGDRITRDQMMQFYYADMRDAWRATGINGGFEPWEMAALWSVAYNSPSAFLPGKSLRCAIDAPARREVRDAIKLYNKVEVEEDVFVVSRGLVKRRAVEAAVWALNELIMDLGPMNPRLSSWQAALFLAGYDPGPIDGLDGPRTQAAWRAFNLQSDSIQHAANREGPATRMRRELSRLGFDLVSEC